MKHTEINTQDFCEVMLGMDAVMRAVGKLAETEVVGPMLFALDVKRRALAVAPAIEREGVPATIRALLKKPGTVVLQATEAWMVTRPAASTSHEVVWSTKVSEQSDRKSVLQVAAYFDDGAVYFFGYLSHDCPSPTARRSIVHKTVAGTTTYYGAMTPNTAFYGDLT